MSLRETVCACFPALLAPPRRPGGPATGTPPLRGAAAHAGEEALAAADVRSIEGRWVNKNNSQPVILQGDQILWDRGQNWTIRAEGGAGFSTTFGGKTFKARRVNSDRLEWDDGEVWTRLQDEGKPLPELAHTVVLVEPDASVGPAPAAPEKTTPEKAVPDVWANVAASDAPWARPTATIESRSVRNGTTFYHVRLDDDHVQIGTTFASDSTTFAKRYNDFVNFDKTMRETNPALHTAMPKIPKPGVLGLQHKLGLEGFEQRRQDGLQEYLSAMAARLDEASLRAFLEKDPQDAL